MAVAGLLATTGATTALDDSSGPAPSATGHPAVARPPVEKLGLTPTWTALATYTTSRNAHFAELGAGVTGVYDSAANTVTLTTPAAGSVRVSGARTAGFTTYGSEVSAQVTLAANTPVTFTPRLLP
jgi:hypothetical protein